MIKQNTLNRPTEPSEISYADEGKKPPYCNKVTKPIARAAIISRDEKNLQKPITHLLSFSRLFIIRYKEYMVNINMKMMANTGLLNLKNSSAVLPINQPTSMITSISNAIPEY